MNISLAFVPLFASARPGLSLCRRMVKVSFNVFKSQGALWDAESPGHDAANVTGIQVRVAHFLRDKVNTAH